MNKQEIRQQYKSMRLALEATQKQEKEHALVQRLFDLPIWDNTKLVHVFLPIAAQHEIDTLPIVHAVWQKNIAVCVPKMIEQGLETFLLEKETPCKENALGIPEPMLGEKIDGKQIDVILLPLLAFDEKGYRIGYGKGYYDYFVANLDSHVLKIGLSLFPPLTEPITELHDKDLQMDYCVFPEGLWQKK
jgi:5-formyltetrahydrofolate cyclo-ligase